MFIFISVSSYFVTVFFLLIFQNLEIIDYLRKLDYFVQYTSQSRKVFKSYFWGKHKYY